MTRQCTPWRMQASLSAPPTGLPLLFTSPIAPSHPVLIFSHCYQLHRSYSAHSLKLFSQDHPSRTDWGCYSGKMPPASRCHCARPSSGASLPRTSTCRNLSPLRLQACQIFLNCHACKRSGEPSVLSCPTRWDPDPFVKWLRLVEVFRYLPPSSVLSFPAAISLRLWGTRPRSPSV